MYPIEIKRLLNNYRFDSKTLLLSCISFEERSIASTEIIYHYNQNFDIEYCFINLVDNSNNYVVKNGVRLIDLCEKKKENWFQRLGYSNHDFETIPVFNLMDPLLIEKLIRFLDDYFNKIPNLKTILFDITSFTKSCLIPILNLLISKYEKYDLILLYTQPKRYGKSLKCEPNEPDFNFLYIRKKMNLIWIPILGFQPEYTKIIWEKIKIERNLLKSIPVLGFPAFRPDFFDKSLIMHGKKFGSDSNFKEFLKNPLYAEANNPFDIYYKLKKIKESYPNSELLLSPLGSKPMTIGASLFAIINKFPIMSIQSNVYYPDYSEGYSKIHSYIIRKDGDLKF